MSEPAGGAQRALYHARVERIFDHAEDTRSLFLRMTEGALPALRSWNVHFSCDSARQ